MSEDILKRLLRQRAEYLKANTVPSEIVISANDIVPLYQALEPLNFPSFTTLPEFEQVIRRGDAHIFGCRLRIA